MKSIEELSTNEILDMVQNTLYDENCEFITGTEEGISYYLDDVIDEIRERANRWLQKS